MVGLTNSRSIQDEKLIEAIFQTHHSPESRASVRIYGATATNLIIDARPTTNAVANTAKGAGTENMDHYKEARKAYLGIDNIHTMRDSLTKVVEALREAETAAAGALGDTSGETPPAPVLDRQALRRSGWLRHISAIVEGSLLIVRNVHISSSHVLIHCSDGWDRTAQLSSLSQLCLDPYYRTIKGFQILIEKDWLSFGHKFLDRCGHLSSEKFFLTPVEVSNNTSGAEAAQAFFASVQNRFASQTHLKETSPVFHQFLESVRQVQRQFPERFEFNERFLRRIYYHLYSCRFGTFLCNSERERRVGEGGPPPCEVTVSVWDFFNSAPEDGLNLNPDYDPSLDDPANRTGKTDMGVLLPNPKNIRFWHELYGRADEEMNGKFVVRQVAQGPEFVAPVESLEDDPSSVNPQASTSSAPPFISLPPSPSRSPAPTLGSMPSSPSLSRVVLERAASPSQGSPIARSTSTPGSMKGRTRHDSLKDFDSGSVGSAYTLKTQGGSTIPPRSPSPMNRSSTLRSPPSPRVSAVPSASDLFSASNVRSVWGKLSSNATAAISAVQDAYGGVTKDFKGLALASGSQADRGGELKGKEEIAAWSEERPASPSNADASYSFETVTNPWSTTSARPGVPSMFLDNPWSTARSPPLATRPSLVDLSFDDPPKKLPDDPAVALPVPRSAQQSSRDTTPSTSSSFVDSSLGSLSSSLSSSTMQTLDIQSTPTSATSPQSPPSTAPFDPLGVGTL